MSILKLAISKNAQILAIFAVICTTMVGLVNLLTKDKIAQQEQLELNKQLNAVITKEQYDNQPYQDCISHIENKGELPISVVYRARLNNMPSAVAIKTAALDGYNGKISLLIAINYDGSISGVRTLKHAETPGLGDKIELRKSAWITSFTGLSLQEHNRKNWAVVKDGGTFDQFTGATITPRAVVKAVKNTLEYFNKHKDTLFNAKANCKANNKHGF